MRSLREVLTNAGANLDGWLLERPTGISGDGMLVIGSGRNPANESEGWIARLPCLAADSNGDGEFDADDIMSFVELLLQVMPATESQICSLDSNGDNLVNIADFAPFVEALLAE